MKKFVVLFALISVLVFAFAGCSNGDTFTEKSYSSGESEIEKVVVQVTDRELEICASEDNQIYIDYFDGEKEYLDISVSQSKELIIKLVFNKDWTSVIGTKPSVEYRKIKIRIPDNLITTISASTTNENIKITNLSFIEKIDLDNNGGNVLLERVSVGKGLNLIAKNGNITGSIIGGWDDFSMACTIKKGDCNLPALKEGGAKSFNANCNNGNINVEFIK
ncbi:MAG: DUF4097 domain-containing protein [Clostridia bacterium]|nr:DUF4097 domain-containing protein [Clostridia bacterium]